LEIEPCFRACPIGTALFSTESGSSQDICVEIEARNLESWDRAREYCQGSLEGGGICPASFYQDGFLPDSNGQAWCTENIRFGMETLSEWVGDFENHAVENVTGCGALPSSTVLESGEESGFRCCAQAKQKTKTNN